MSYLINLQRAIHATLLDDSTKMLGQDYYEGWVDSGLDIMYGLDCGETACKQHIKNWLDTTPCEWDANNQGYYDRIKAIQEYMEAQHETV